MVVVIGAVQGQVTLFRVPRLVSNRSRKPVWLISVVCSALLEKATGRWRCQRTGRPHGCGEDFHE